MKHPRFLAGTTVPAQFRYLYTTTKISSSRIRLTDFELCVKWLTDIKSRIIPNILGRQYGNALSVIRAEVRKAAENALYLSRPRSLTRVREAPRRLRKGTLLDLPLRLGKSIQIKKKKRRQQFAPKYIREFKKANPREIESENPNSQQSWKDTSHFYEKFFS